MTENLVQKQIRFTKAVAGLLNKVSDFGFDGVTFGETYRPPETAKLYASMKIGIANSLHTQRLAVDLNFFKNGVYVSDTEKLRGIGEWWESQGGTWGGRFKDGNHFSFEHNGVK